MKNNNTIIHISGFPGSGKSTLGELIQKKFKNVIVHDTDEFIQHHTKEGKMLLKLEKEIDNREKTLKDYKSLWKEIIKEKIDNFISRYQDKIIVFVGSLDNFAPSNTIYNIEANYKFLLDIPLDELLKRYYLRIYLTEQKRTKQSSNSYWKKLSSNTYYIMSSEEIIKDYARYNLWHKKNNYIFMTDKQIINNIKKIITYTKFNN